MTCNTPSFDLDALDVNECIREVYLAAVLPGTLAFIVACRDALQLTRWRRKSLWPRPWVSADDLLVDEKSAEDDDGGVVPVESPAKWKRTTLAALSGLSAVGYLAAAALESGHRLGRPPLHVVTGLIWVHLLRIQSNLQS